MSDSLEEKEMPRPTASHIVAFAFHKLAGSEPDYNKWAEFIFDSRNLNLGFAGKRHEISKIRNSFINRFKSYKIDEEEIRVIFPISFEIIEVNDSFALNIYFQKGSMNLPLIINETPEFDINLIIPEAEAALKTVLTLDEYARFERNSGGLDLTGKLIPANLVLYARPVSVDAEKPLYIQNEPVWLMLTEFVTYEIWNTSKRDPFRYWTYVSEEEKLRNVRELQSLFKENDEPVEEPKIYDDLFKPKEIFE